MKKTLIASLVVIFTSAGAFAGPLGDWAQQTTNKINQQEAAVTQKQEAARLEREKQQAEQQKKRDAAQKKIEHKKKLWNELISE